MGDGWGSTQSTKIITHTISENTIGSDSILLIAFKLPTNKSYISEGKIKNIKTISMALSHVIQLHS